MTAARLAWSWCALTLALAAAAVALATADGTAPLSVVHLLFVAACALAGGLVCAHRPGHAVGRLLALSAFCFALMEACGHYALLGLARPGLPFTGALAWPQTWLWVPANLAPTLIPLFFPGGRLSSPALRPLVAGAVAVAAAAATVSALTPGENHQVGVGTGLPNPLGVPALAGLAPIPEAVLTVLLPLVFVTGAVDLAVRAWRSGEIGRRQIVWLVYVVAIETAVIGARLTAGLTDDVPDAVWPATDIVWELVGASGATLIPVAICAAVLRRRLFDIDLVINRTLVYGLLSGCVTGGYVLAVGYLGTVLPTGGPTVPVLAAGLVALVFAPLRRRLQSWVNLLVYGERDDPYAALTRLGRRLESTADPDTVLPGVARSVAEALRLPYAAVETAGGDRYAHGTAGLAEAAGAGPVRLPLTHNGERVGALVLSPRPGESRFGTRDLRVLSDLARQVAVAVHAVRLSADLRRSRERLVMAREEERRRLRRDLHDGLGPTLAALTMRAEAAHDLVADERARRLLTEIVGDAEAALADVRTLVDGLRPPALDSLGLTGALRVHATREPSGLRVDVHAPDDLPALPAATEVAAYRIAGEALANARRHAGATRAELRIEAVDGTLRLEISDDGRGIGPHGLAARSWDAGIGDTGAGSTGAGDAGIGDTGAGSTGAGDAGPRGTGVGLASMRERAVELGGSCTFEERPGGGTLVRVELPAGERRNRSDQCPGGRRPPGVPRGAADPPVDGRGDRGP
ncbi:signal transduction histidine kinase [Streptosporangium becharense]|uniref:Oxygen sensor histidine kinase NreB n=1 Tax=Streptosporangium becharense TaxID=1816182 RepID=A0A7W9IF12_9ACTN|nr:sensor histidine kinase [Streptosporangium becharense]MBB2909754.1 signal transduction histidine kinase [Streptosporangium becharense]MBB5819290.1 signal transduction histidine kinase [Streptosporangium becharense]